MTEDATDYVRQLAWLAATPKGQDKSRREAYGDEAVQEPPGHARWLVEAAAECGLVASNGLGATAVSWQEIHSWAAATGQRGAWLRLVIRNLSAAYVKELRAAEDPARPAPMAQKDVVEQRKGVMNQLKRFVQNRR